MSGKVAEAAVLQGAASGGLSSDSGFDPQLGQKPRNISHGRGHTSCISESLCGSLCRGWLVGQEWEQLESCKV